MTTKQTVCSFRRIAATALATGTMAFGALALTAPAANATADIGGLDIQNNFCGPIFNAQATAENPGSAFSWVCIRNGERVAHVDMNRVCINQYGFPTFALPTDLQNAGSWRCYR